ncbi:hypothetical protein HK102_000053 [Quaeritorhiza haematococci]|nr:hypothetical protein HK102_000053 [Quaeritorhiza haematococci]
MNTTPKLTVRWFRATDVPKRDNRPYRNFSSNNKPINWVAFSVRDSDAIEEVYQKLLQRKEDSSEQAGVDVSPIVPVSEDDLYEVNVENRETYPGRGTWFILDNNNNFLPCDDNLAQQVENGYRKYQPWKDGPVELSAIPKSFSSSDGEIDPSSTSSSSSPSKTVETYVVYTGPTTAILRSDVLTAILARAVMTKLTHNDNVGGTRLIRGWDEVEQRQKSAAKRNSGKEKEEEKKRDVAARSLDRKASDTSLSAEDLEVLSAAPPSDLVVDGLNPPEETQPRLSDAGHSEDRSITHLILAIHGIGQKLGERLEVIDFVNDCNVLRRTLKNCAQQLYGAGGRSKSPESVPEGGGVQVLPVHWRQKMDFGRSNKKSDDKDDKNADSSADSSSVKTIDEETTLEDITLEGVPSIRTLVSDVIMDVLLYMTPRYRQEMIDHVTEELNRIYRLFKERHPKFSGKVSIYAHSLGSLLAYDILCNQNLSSNGSTSNTSTAPAGRSKQNSTSKEVDLSDMLRGILTDGSRANNVDDSRITYGRLDFEVDRLFDPVAYRVEPMVHRSFASEKPFPVPYTKGGLKGTIVGIQDLGNELVDRGRSMFASMRQVVTTTVGVSKVVDLVSTVRFKTGLSPERPSSNGGQPGARSRSVNNADGKDEAAGSEAGNGENGGRRVSEPDVIDMSLLNPRGRIDYAIQEGVLENPYISALAVHTNYWSDQDVSVFILKELYG